MLISFYDANGCGRNAISRDRKFAPDVWYVDNRNIWLDLETLWRTLLKVIKRESISAKGEASMRKFEGERK